MIILFHGENILASRRALIEKIKVFKAKKVEIISLDGRKVSLTEIKQACEAKSLFGAGRLVIIERFYARPRSHEKTVINRYFQNLPASIDLIFWEEKQLTPSQLKILPQQVKIYLFKIQPVIFKFVDSFYPGNPRTSLNLLGQCLRVEAAEMIFYMLCRQVRLLILAKDSGKKGLTGLPFWMQNKFLRQSRRFSLEQLLAIHQKLLITDYEQKTGLSLMPLDFQLDLLVASL